MRFHNIPKKKINEYNHVAILSLEKYFIVISKLLYIEFNLYFQSFSTMPCLIEFFMFRTFCKLLKLHFQISQWINVTVVIDLKLEDFGDICPDSLDLNKQTTGIPYLTHWGRVTHIYVGKLTNTDNGLLPGRRQIIIWTNAGILVNGPLGTNFRKIHIFSFKKMHLKMSSANWRLFCLGVNVF